MKEQKATEINEIRKSHEVYITRLEEEHSVAVSKLHVQHSESIKTLQTKQENQMEGKLSLYKIHYNLHYRFYFPCLSMSWLNRQTWYTEIHIVLINWDFTCKNNKIITFMLELLRVADV